MSNPTSATLKTTNAKHTDPRATMDVHQLGEATNHCFGAVVLHQAIENKQQGYLIDAYKKALEINGLTDPPTKQSWIDAVKAKEESSNGTPWYKWSTVHYYAGKFRIKSRNITLGNCVQCYKPPPVGQRCYPCSPEVLEPDEFTKARQLVFAWTPLPFDELKNQGRPKVHPLQLGDLLNYAPHISLDDNDHRPPPEPLWEAVRADLPHFFRMADERETLQGIVPNFYQVLSDNLHVTDEEITSAYWHTEENESWIFRNEDQDAILNARAIRRMRYKEDDVDEAIEAGVVPIQPPPDNDPDVFY